MGLLRQTYEVLNGSLLGDGGLSTVSGRVNSRHKVQRNAEFHDYNIWLMTEMGDIPWEQTSPRLGETYDARTAKTYYWSRIRSRRHVELSILRDLWYPEGTKTVPRDFVEYFWSDLALLVWVADDGSFFKVDVPRRDGFKRELRFKLATNGFTHEDVLWLAELLSRKTGFHFRVDHNGNEQWVIVMPPSEVLEFQQNLAHLNPVTSLGRKFGGVGGYDNRT